MGLGRRARSRVAGSHAWRTWLLSPMRPRARADLLALGVLVAIAFLIRLIPHVRSGGLWGVIGYDDGVYFASAVAMTEGVLPYRDFLLVHPPGEPVVLLPFAVLGAWMGDGTALTIARIATMVAGAVSCVLAALVCGRSSRLAGLLAGLVYATWRAAAVGDRSTDLHAPQRPPFGLSHRARSIRCAL